MSVFPLINNTSLRFTSRSTNNREYCDDRLDETEEHHYSVPRWQPPVRSVHSSQSCLFAIYSKSCFFAKRNNWYVTPLFDLCSVYSSELNCYTIDLYSTQRSVIILCFQFHPLWLFSLFYQREFSLCAGVCFVVMVRKASLCWLECVWEGISFDSVFVDRFINDLHKMYLENAALSFKL